MEQEHSVFTAALIKSFEASGLDLNKPATVEDVLHIVGGVADVLVREGQAERVADQIISDLKRR